MARVLVKLIFLAFTATPLWANQPCSEILAYKDLFESQSQMTLGNVMYEFRNHFFEIDSLIQSGRSKHPIPDADLVANVDRIHKIRAWILVAIDKSSSTMIPKKLSGIEQSKKQALLMDYQEALKSFDSLLQSLEEEFVKLSKTSADQRDFTAAYATATEIRNLEHDSHRRF